VEERLRGVDHRKNVFLATLAHELRNPLAPLQNALNIRRLQSAAGDPLQATMERQLALLVRMIDDLLDIARISQGKLTLRPGEVVLSRVLDAAVEIARPWLDGGGHNFQVRLPATELVLRADEARLAQVFANLLNNAAKYSDPGSRIELEASLDEARDEVVVSVRDNGIGLARETLDEVFEIFRQVDTTVERAQGGLGIGLTLVQKITEMHDGCVQVESDGLGHGSTFRVRLPRAGAAPGACPGSAAAAVAVADIAAPSGRGRVLVVDDNRDAADTLAMMVRTLGHDVALLYDPLQVEAEVERFDPGLVFLDVGMPGRSGYDIARSLRAQRAADTLAIVAVTGWGHAEDRDRSREAGFDEHLVKPPQLDAIRRLCAGAGQRSAG